MASPHLIAHTLTPLTILAPLRIGEILYASRDRMINQHL
jgi:hypothetical protein